MRLPRNIVLVHVISCREVRSAKALYRSTSVDLPVLPGHKQTLRLPHCGIEFNPIQASRELNAVTANAFTLEPASYSSDRLHAG